MLYRVSFPTTVCICFFLGAAYSLRFKPINWQAAKRSGQAASDLDPDTMQMLLAAYRSVQSEMDKRSGNEEAAATTNWNQHQEELPNAEDEKAPVAGQMEKKNARHTRTYKNCFLSPVQCVMKGRAYSY